MEMVAQSRGKELCIALRPAAHGQSKPPRVVCPTCEAIGSTRSGGSGSDDEQWFPLASEAPRAWEPPRWRSPPPQTAASNDGVALVTMARMMDGLLCEQAPHRPLPAGTLLTLRREDGSALCFLQDGTCTEERRASGRKAIARGKLFLGMWSAHRGPDPLTQHDAFRARVLRLLDNDDQLLRRPICETMLDQKLFNGVGNYLRAEILHRAAIPPFELTATVLRAAVRSADAARGGGGSGGGGGSDEDGCEDVGLLTLTRDVLHEAVSVPDDAWLDWLRIGADDSNAKMVVMGGLHERDPYGVYVWVLQGGRGVDRSCTLLV